ncbi:MAG: hypothetical protein ACOYT8_05260 [Candidatus Dependentiae bacterium]
MKNKIVVLILTSAGIIYNLRAVDINFELRNHESYPISIKIFQKAGARLQDKRQIRTAAHSYVTTIPAKKGNKISSATYSADAYKPTYLRISYYSNGIDITRYFGLPVGRTLFLAFKEGKLLPQQGILFGKITSSGHSLSNNVKAQEIVELNQDDIGLIENGLEY